MGLIVVGLFNVVSESTTKFLVSGHPDVTVHTATRGPRQVRVSLQTGGET